jgi:phage terminase Nu1 subunit (DNA packaging protein)
LELPSWCYRPLSKRGILVHGRKQATCEFEAPVGGYCEHLRAVAAGCGGEGGGQVRARLGAAQADLAEAKAEQLRGELVESDAVKAKWSSTYWAIRARMPAVADRMPDLPTRHHEKLSRELRDPLTELSDGAAK